MSSAGTIAVGLAVAAATAGGGGQHTLAQEGPKTRTFQFSYGAQITGLPPGQRVRVWLPVPSSSEQQEVEIVRKQLPAPSRLAKEPKYGNRVLSFQVSGPPSGSLTLRVVYRVKRYEVRRAGLPADRQHQGRDRSGARPVLDPAQRALFLQPNRLVPVSGAPLELLAGRRLDRQPARRARQLYDLVRQHMAYRKEGVGWGRGDVLWACRSGYGNCTDFHSLFISLARSQGLPARFVIGFPLPPQRGSGQVTGYHCWAFFFLDGLGWLPVDVSEADKHPELADYYFGNLSPDRVAFSTGRDLRLVPPQAGPPLNYFIYPYVEVDGRPHPNDMIRLKFGYEDL